MAAIRWYGTHTGFQGHGGGARAARSALSRGAPYGGDERLSRRRHGRRQGHSARPGQCRARLRGVGRGNQETEQEPAPDVRSARQPEHREFLRYRERPAEENAGEAARDGYSWLRTEATARAFRRPLGLDSLSFPSPLAGVGQGQGRFAVPFAEPPSVIATARGQN